MLLILGALLCSLSLLAQGRGDGKGNGRGSGGEHIGNPGQKREYRNVNAVTVFTSSGVELYKWTNEPAGSKKASSTDKVDWVETSQDIVRVYFKSSDEKQRILELKCENCAVLIDHVAIAGAARP